MTIERTEGLVLRTVDFSESSKIVTLFTRDFGKLGAMAKGGRRLKSSFEVSLDVLCVLDIGVIRKTSADLDLLTEAMLKERHAGLGRSLPALYAGYYVAETLDGLLQPHDPHEDLYQSTLAMLDRLANDGPVGELLCRYLAKLLDALGLFPSLERCVGCGGPVAWKKRVPYSIPASGVLCEACAPSVVSRRILALAIVELLSRFGSEPMDSPGHGPTDAIVGPGNGGELSELWRVLAGHIEFHLGRRPRTAEWIRV